MFSRKIRCSGRKYRLKSTDSLLFFIGKRTPSLRRSDAARAREAGDVFRKGSPFPESGGLPVKTEGTESAKRSHASPEKRLFFHCGFDEIAHFVAHVGHSAGYNMSIEYALGNAGDDLVRLFSSVKLLDHGEVLEVLDSVAQVLKADRADRSVKSVSLSAVDQSAVSVGEFGVDLAPFRTCSTMR